MNTIEIAIAHLLAEGFEFVSTDRDDEGQYRALVVTIRHADRSQIRTVRVWTEDLEGHVAIAIADAWGYSLGAKVEAHGASLIRATFPALFAAVVSAFGA